jgi:hypothetical protein
MIIAVLFTWSWRALLGLRFQSIQTPYDYLAHAIEWLPWHLILLGLTTIFSFGLSAFFKKERPQYPSGIREKKQRKRKEITLGIFLALIVMWVIETFWRSMDELSFRAATTLIMIYVAIVLVWDDRLLRTPTGKLLFSLPLLVGMAFLLGAQDARNGLGSSENVYRIEPKSGDPFNVNLLRSLEKGLLVWDSAVHRITLIRWDEVNRMSHFGPVRDKTTVGCRFTKFMCPETTTP